MKFCSSWVDEDEVEGQFGVEPNAGREDEAPKVATVGNLAADEDGEVMRDGITRLRRLAVYPVIVSDGEEPNALFG